jgi:ribosome maturation factor RimP
VHDGDRLEAGLAERVEALGFELVRLERAGSRARPILRLSIDRPESEPGESGVTLDDCTRVSRALEPWLDELEGLAPSYVLEVSSPGVERPLVRPRDFERFAGREVAVKGKATLAGRAKRLEGVLLGLREVEGEAGPEERIALRLADGDEVEIPRAEITDAHLIYRWERGRRG